MALPASLKVMLMGDSITKGTIPGGYRAPLDTLLTTDGFGVSYVGDQTTNLGGGLPDTQDNHEAIDGATSVDIKAQIDSSGIVKTSQPNAVLLLIGTNDPGHGVTQADFDTNIAALMDAIIAQDPTVHIFLANILHRADDDTGWVTAFDATLPALVAPRAAYVTLVDTASALTLADLDPGGLHPTQAGYDKLATAWNTAITGYYGTPAAGLSIIDLTTSQALPPVVHPYSGPVAGVTSEYIATTADRLNIAASTPNWFIKSNGSTITVSSGTNVLDGGTGSSFLVGGTGADSFYVDDRALTATVWSTIMNFHSADNATIWGITAADFSLIWLADQGAPGATGLTAVFASHTAGVPEARVTLAGYNQADLTNSKLSISYGTTPSQPNLPGSNYITIHAT
jgi:lysophospholipase L1-like esterase